MSRYIPNKPNGAQNYPNFKILISDLDTSESYTHS